MSAFHPGKHRGGRRQQASAQPAVTVAAIPEALPATLLRAVPRDGSEGSSREVLTGWPTYEGPRVTGTGQHAEGLCIGDDGDIAVVLESASAEYLDELARAALRAAAAKRARDAQAHITRPGSAAAGGAA